MRIFCYRIFRLIRRGSFVRSEKYALTILKLASHIYSYVEWTTTGLDEHFAPSGMTFSTRPHGKTEEATSVNEQQKAQGKPFSISFANDLCKCFCEIITMSIIYLPYQFYPRGYQFDTM